jgi:hypothetical protein
MAPFSLSAPPLPLAEFLDRFDREQRDARAATIANRIAANATPHRQRRHTATHLRRLAWPVYVDGRQCTAAVTLHYICHPRERERETFWYADVAEARAAHPNAVMLPDVDRVQARLNA